jgi:hypothetical protein
VWNNTSTLLLACVALGRFNPILYSDIFIVVLISRAAAVIASAYAGPGVSGAVGVRTSPSALAYMISIGALMKAAPGRPDSAAWKAFATTSETEFGESISAENFMIGRNRSTVSIL